LASSFVLAKRGRGKNRQRGSRGSETNHTEKKKKKKKKKHKKNLYEIPREWLQHDNWDLGWK